MKFATLAPTGSLYNIRTGGEIVKFLSPGIRFKPHFKGVWGFSSALPQGLKAGALHGESPTPPPIGTVGKIGSTPTGRNQQHKLRGFFRG